MINYQVFQKLNYILELQKMIISVLLISLLASSCCSSLVGASDNELNNNNNSDTTYGVIVDCGSSGTRANIYEWNSNLEYPELLHDIEPMRDSSGQPVSKKIKPGLASLADNPSASSDYMKPIIDFITDKIPKESWSSTGIFFMGTAGMRLLDTDTQLSIMNDIAAELKSNYNFAKVNTSVISGTREGIYQWITVNSRLKRFNLKTKPSTYAVMEMGGASMQITYQLGPGMFEAISRSLTKSPEALRSFHGQVVEPQMSGKSKNRAKLKIFSTSFLGFGSNSVREAYVDLLIMSNQRNRFHKARGRIISTRFNSGRKTLQISDPCLPINSIQKMNKPTRMLTSSNQTVGFVPDDDEPQFEVRLIGKGKFHKCRLLLNAFLQIAKNEKMNCKPKEFCPMSLLGTPFVPYNLEFKGLSDFYYTTKEMMNLDGAFNRNNVIKAARKICAMSYEGLLKMYPEANNNDPSRILLECFKAIWIDVFLTDGTRMPSNNHNLQTIGQINGQSIDWTLGAVLDKSLAIEKATEEVGALG